MRSKEFQALCQRYQTRIFFTANYNPRANPTERHNRVIKTMLSTYVRQEDHRTWDEHLQEIGCAMRTSPSEVTGYSPYFVLFGREHNLFGNDYALKLPPDPLDLTTYIKIRQEGFIKLFKQIQGKIETARTHNANRYNLRRRPLVLDPSDRVWRKNKITSDAANYITAKLAPQFVGPFTVKRKCGSWSYELQDDQGNLRGVWHVQDLKPFFDPSDAGTLHEA